MAVDCAICGELIETSEDAMVIELIRDHRRVQLVIHPRCKARL
jgi:hypothetical protein